MTELTNYIFNHLNLTESAIRGVRKTLRHQKSFNKNVAVFAWAAAGYLVFSEIDRRRQGKKIEKLENEVSRLKCSEGDQKCDG